MIDTAKLKEAITQIIRDRMVSSWETNRVEHAADLIIDELIEPLRQELSELRVAAEREAQREKTMQDLADQAQELDMGYEAAAQESRAKIKRAWAEVAEKVAKDAALSGTVERGAVTEERLLPCDVMVPPTTVIREGCKIGTLLEAIEHRRGRANAALSFRPAAPQVTREEIAVAACGTGVLCDDPIDGRQSGSCHLCGGVAERIMALIGRPA